MASRTASAPCPASAGPFLTRAPSPWPGMRGRWSNIVNLVVRSTSVPIAELRRPRMRSPSQWPGTARSSASAGRWLTITSGATCDFPRPRHRAAALDVERLVDGLVADPHRLVAGEVEPQPPGDLLRAPRARPAPVLPPSVTTAFPGHRRPGDRRPAGSDDGAGQPVSHVRPQRRVRGQLRTPRRPLGVPLGRGGAILQAAAPRRSVAPQLARDRRRRPPEPPGDLPHPAPLRTPQRDLLAFRERQVPPRGRPRRPRQRRWWHAARLPEP